MSPKILAIDTSTENCSVALAIGDTHYIRSEVAPRDHAKKILPMVDEVLKEAGVALNDLDALAFGRGPGSFTGVRIGIGIAQGLAFGASLNVIPVSTLEAMAQGAYRLSKSTSVAVAIDARMSEVYWARYQFVASGKWQLIDDECVIAPEQLIATSRADDELWVSAGTGWETYVEILNNLPYAVSESPVRFPEAEDMLELAKVRFANGEWVSAEHAEPVYLRDTVTWKKLPGRE